MSLFKQLGLTLCVALVAIVIWAVYVPAAQPWLNRLGLLGFFQEAGLIIKPQENAQTKQGEGARNGALVVAVAAQFQDLNDRVSAIGSARGVRSIVIEAEVAGQIEALSVEPGHFVEAGAVLARLDDEAEAIAMDRAALIEADASTNLTRIMELKARNAATDTQVQEAQLAHKTAQLQLREAEFELARRNIVAPFAGWVGILAVELGDRVEPGLEITRLEDRSSLIVDFRVPERVVSMLTVGDSLTAFPLAERGQQMTGRIIALDNRVDEKSRSLLVQARIENAEDALRAGMAFSIELDFTGDRYPSVDPLAIQWDTSGSFIWVVRDGKAARLPVRIVQRTSDTVLVAGDVSEGDLVVTEGVQALRPGADVTLTHEEGAEAAQLLPQPSRI